MNICDELESNSASDYGGVGEEYDHCFRIHWSFLRDGNASGLANETNLFKAIVRVIEKKRGITNRDLNLHTRDDGSPSVISLHQSPRRTERKMDDTILGLLICCAPTLIAMFRCHRDLETIAIMNPIVWLDDSLLVRRAIVRYLTGRRVSRSLFSFQI